MLLARQFTCEEKTKPSEQLRRWALALEMLHSYSLVHDDLPSMDNDDFRRALPTVHRLHGEAAGVLIGDALLTGAFELMVSQLSCEARVAVKATAYLAAAALSLIHI